MKDPNAPKKPLSAYFLFSQDERLKVKAEYPDYSITEVAKELGRRWASIDPAVKVQYEQRYQESRKQYEQAMTAYKPQKKKKDPNAPKQPLSAYFIFSSEERQKVTFYHFVFCLFTLLVLSKVFLIEVKRFVLNYYIIFRLLGKSNTSRIFNMRGC
jgi:hypothetical protein